MFSRIQSPALPRRGAIMSIALMILLCSGLFLMGWITIMGARSIQVSWLETAVQRRISLENSRLLSWQTAMEHGFDPKETLANQSTPLDGGKSGGVNTLNVWKDRDIYSSEISPDESTTYYPYNPIGLRPGRAFYIYEKFARPDGQTTLDPYTAYLFTKGQNPVLCGDLFVVYRKPDSALRELNVYSNVSPFRVEGRVIVRHPPSLFVTTTSSVTLPILSKSLYIQSHNVSNHYKIIGTDLNAANMPPSNLSVIPSSGGPVSATDKKLFDGYLNVVRNDANPSNSLWHTMEKQGSDNIQAYVDGLPSSNPYWMAKYDYTNRPPNPPADFDSGGYDIPYRTLYINVGHPDLKHLRITNAGGLVDQIVFVGQPADAFEAAGKMNPVIVGLVQGSGKPLRSIVFDGNNNRRLILGFKNNSASSTQFIERQLDFTWAGSPLAGSALNWRMTLINEGHRIWLGLHKNSSIDINWIGGVMTNWSFERSTNTGPRAERLTFKPDGAVPTAVVTGVNYETLLPRDAWLETFFLPDPPPKAP